MGSVAKKVAPLALGVLGAAYGIPLLAGGGGAEAGIWGAAKAGATSLLGPAAAGAATGSALSNAATGAAVGAVASGALAGKQPDEEPAPAPVVTKPKVMPVADDEMVKRARRRSLLEQMNRRGRSSTILSDGDTLG